MQKPAAEPGHGGESKRYVVVSHDLHNRTTGRPVVVGTTSQPKRDHRSFPAIEGGAARACCGDAVTIIARELRCRPGDHRPAPSSLSLSDMVAVAHGMAKTHGLSAGPAGVGLSDSRPEQAYATAWLSNCVRYSSE